MKKVCLVTGASRGIGRAVAAALGAKGHAVAVHYRERRDGAEETARLVAEGGGTALLVRGDIASGADRARILGETEQGLGPLSVLVQNAGAAPAERVDLLAEGEDSVRRMLDVNLEGPWLLARDAAKRMLAGPPGEKCILWITSVSASSASLDRASYCLAKAGASMGAKLLALRLAREGIPVWEIRPGVIETDMTAPVLGSYRKRAREGLVPEGRTGMPGDVARLAAALVEGAAPYSTGSVFHVDGGLHLERL